MLMLVRHRGAQNGMCDIARIYKLAYFILIMLKPELLLKEKCEISLPRNYV